MGGRTWLQYDWSGLQTVVVDRLVVDARVAYREGTKGYSLRCETSVDGQTWTPMGVVAADTLPGKVLRYKLHSDPNKQTGEDLLPVRRMSVEIPLQQRVSTQHLRVTFDMDGAAYWMVYDVHFFDGVREFWPLSSEQFCSMWMSDGGGPQWLYVDLGTESQIDSIVPRWHEEPRRWHTEVEENGRRVRLVMEEPGESGCYALRELEVFGTALSPHPETSSSWHLQRASEVHASGEEIASESFDADGWIEATVPGTVLTSYINIGAVPDPNYADNVDQISESFFRSNFWYRKVIPIKPDEMKTDSRTLLCFDGINWKANVYMNGQRLGRIEGAFQRAQFDVTSLLHDGDNYVAVEILCNEHFGAVKEKSADDTQFNGGLLGADNPTFHASIGWDWITTVRGREAGIWNEVYLKQVHGGIELIDPYVQTTIENGKVSVTPSVFVKNHHDVPVTTRLKGWIGDTTFEKQLSLPAHSEQEVGFSPNDFPQLCRTDFRLWWPNGYGEPYLYEAGYKLTTDFPVSERGAGGDSLSYRAGLRQLHYVDADDSLRIYINGRRFVALGGNWGFPEHNLQYSKADYDAAVAYHRDMHCTMIRNWVGQTGHRAFYDACDSLGIMVWQDFWLANPTDGPDPTDEPMFLSNARDYVRRIRRHASIGLYCGRNEGFPPKTIDRALRHYVDSLSPGLCYISSSADGGVTGHGPYSAQPARVYFERQTGKLHTERGMPAVMNIESLRRTFEPDSLWPQSVQWGQHDYTLKDAQRASEFNALVEQAFGPSDDAEQFARRAQLINYNGYRAMFESGSRTRSGLLIWMSHPCWPTMVWQTYDYYKDPTAAYFGVKKACEPLHIQWNALTDSVEVVNLFAGQRFGLKATATLYDAVTARVLWQQAATLYSRDDSTIPLFPVKTATNCGLLRLQLDDDAGRLLSLNDYLVNDMRPLTTLTAPQLYQQTVVDGDTLTVTLRNDGPAVIPFIRLNLKDRDDRQVLPALYSDNYITLLPEECRIVTIVAPHLCASGGPVVEMETFSGSVDYEEQSKFHKEP